MSSALGTGDSNSGDASCSVLRLRDFQSIREKDVSGSLDNESIHRVPSQVISPC